MSYNFDQIIPRTDTDCIKWDFYGHGGQPVEWNGCENNQTLPLWVADMDFPSPQPVIDALTERARHGFFGYTGLTQEYYQTVIHWMKKRHGWEVEQDWIVNTPGVVTALFQLVQTFVKPGEKVIVQPPVYHPFYYAIEENGAVIARNPLIYKNGQYEMDFDDLALKAADPDVKMLILCHPHNPIGRVWRPDELRRLGQICLENGVLVVSDEIHGDLIHAGHSFTPYARLSADLAQNAIVCTAPSKTFNLPGLKMSNIIIPHAGLREAFQKTLTRGGIYGANAFGVVAVKAAYRAGEDWLGQVLAYIQANYQFLTDYLRENIPQIFAVPLEGTYLAWLDCRALGMEDKALMNLLLEKAKVYLDEGTIFGPEGAGFLRVNIACPRAILAEALARMKEVLSAV
ncbi:MAG: pyridoxal phosphate-dependent aminotransferase [Anaerolineales bacterium]